MFGLHRVIRVHVYVHVHVHVIHAGCVDIRTSMLLVLIIKNVQAIMHYRLFIHTIIYKQLIGCCNCFISSYVLTGLHVYIQ